MSVSPSVGRRRPGEFIITNQARQAESLAILRAGAAAGQPLADTGPINPQATAQVTVNLSSPGRYSLATAAVAAAQIGRLAGARRTTALQPSPAPGAHAARPSGVTRRRRCSVAATAVHASAVSGRRPLRPRVRPRTRPPTPGRAAATAVAACAILACVQATQVRRRRAATTDATAATATRRSPSDLYALIVYLHKNCNADLFEAVGALELSLTQIKLLHHLEDQPRELSLKEAAEVVHVSLPAASRMVDDLVRRGFAQRREDDDDRRMKRVCLTDGGRTAIRRLNAARLTGLEQFTRELDRPPSGNRSHRRSSSCSSATTSPPAARRA